MKPQFKLKSEKDIEGIAAAGRVLARALRLVKEAVRPGISAAELDKIAEAEVLRLGGRPSFKGYGSGKMLFPSALCVSVNKVVVHGAPSADIILREGDVVGLDLGVNLNGYFADGAVSVPVGQASPAAKHLLSVTQICLDLAIERSILGNKIGDISSVIQKTAEAAGFSVVRDLIGHGVGFAVHEDPAVPCFGRAGTGPELTEGMVLAIEPMVCAGGFEVRSDPGEWPVYTADGSLAAHFEHTVAITKQGPRVLTLEN